LLFAAEGATVLAVDRDIASAEQTVALIRCDGGEAQAFEADVLDEEALRLAVAECVSRWGRLDVLHNNVGISVAGGGASMLCLSCASRAAAPSSIFRRSPRSRTIRG
jgi:NAD(P)-dependent dehydrogenase (short-subunit alcohol dehydrogenase family)